MLLLFDHSGTSVNTIRAQLAEGAGAPAGARMIVDSDLVDGEWPHVGRRSLDYSGFDLDALLERERRGSTTSVAHLLRGYAGIDPYDNFQPIESDTYLVPNYDPIHRVARRSVFKLRLREEFGDTPKEVTKGPTTAHLLVDYPGAGKPFPTSPYNELKRIADQLGELLGPSGRQNMIGGGHDGQLDLFVRWDDAAKVIASRERLVADLELAGDRALTCYAQFEFDWRGALSRR